MVPVSVNGTSAAPPVSTAPEQPTTAPQPHPSQKWECAYVYAFIVKFTTLRKSIEGFETPMDLENALMLPSSDPVMVAILVGFIQNLKPATRDTEARVEKLLYNILEDFCNKENNRSIWWNEERRRNIHPLLGKEGGFFVLPWLEKLAILRQLVDWQLTYCVRIKDMLDLAWGVRAAKHQKKADKDANAPPPPEHPESRENIRLDPFGQDSTRKRYWVLDDSPRIYQSGNPWKAICPFDTLSSTREEFVGVIQDLKSRAPASTEDSAAGAKAKPRPKLEQGHLDLLNKLETEQLPRVDEEIVRAEKAKKRFEQKLLLVAQAESRGTRTRRTTKRPDYVYDFKEDEEEEIDELEDDYTYDTPNDNDFIDDMDIDDGNGSRAGSSSGGGGGRRRSSRSAAVTSRIKTKRMSEAGTSSTRSVSDSYRGERRSTRLGNAPAIAFDESDLELLPSAAKKARSSLAAEVSALTSSAAALVRAPKPLPAPPSDVMAPPGKKRSKFWYYAVDPLPGSGAETPVSAADGTSAAGTPAQVPMELAPNGTPSDKGDRTSNGHFLRAFDDSSMVDGHSAAPSEAGVSLLNGMEGVELTDGKSDVGETHDVITTNGNGNGHAVPPKSPSSDKMEMSENESE